MKQKGQVLFVSKFLVGEWRFLHYFFGISRFRTQFHLLSDKIVNYIVAQKETQKYLTKVLRKEQLYSILKM